MARRQPAGWGQPPVGWGQPLPGWTPLVDHGPRSLQAARALGRWWWPMVTATGFLAVVVQVLSHDDRAPGLSVPGLLTIALAAAVVVLLTIRRTAGPGPLARAVAEYAVVALLASLLVPAGGAVVDQQPPDRPTRAEAQAAGGDDQPALIRAGATVVRGVTGAARTVAGAVRWLVGLWRQADQQATPPKGEAMAASPRSPTPSVLSLRRSL